MPKASDGIFYYLYQSLLAENKFKKRHDKKNENNQLGSIHYRKS